MKALGHTLLVGAVAAAVLGAAPAASGRDSGLEKARQGTAAYHDLDAAQADGYGLFTDAQGIACIDRPGVGAMGVHHVRGALVGDAVLDPRTPEALVYEPRADGPPKLVAVEWVVFHDAWHETHTDPPALFGRDFELVPAGNRYGIPAFYEIHVWAWRNNPTGSFADFNPQVSCAGQPLP